MASSPYAGDALAARDTAERVLRRLPGDNLLERLPALELSVRARIALTELEAAAEASGEVAEIAASLGTPYMLGRARLVAGELSLAQGLADEARRAGDLPAQAEAGVHVVGPR